MYSEAYERNIVLFSRDYLGNISDTFLKGRNANGGVEPSQV